MSGPVAGLFRSLLEEMSGRNEFSVFIEDVQRRRILRSVLEAYYADAPAEVIFDTNRSWCSRLPLLAELFPDSKVIACVRSLPWILDSLERLARRNHLQPSAIANYHAGGTVYTRTSALAGSDGVVGYAYDALKEAIYGEQAVGRLILLPYEHLVRDPRRVIDALYAALGEPVYPHDFSRLSFQAEDFDRKAGAPGLHAVRPMVEAVPRKTVLPPDLFQRFVRDAFWEEPGNLPAGLQVL